MGAARQGLSPRVRATLDVARALAAGYVVLHHVARAHGWSHGPGIVLRFGQEAVLVFFLLSGFVIFANERVRALHPRGYYWRRLRRIYPGLIAAMLLSTLVAIDNGDLLRRFDWRSLVGTLFALQDIAALKPGVITDPYLGNDPLWSLSYEIAFYIVFPWVLRAWTAHPRRTTIAVGATCCAAYGLFVAWPNHVALVAAYFLIWWCGAMAADAYLRGANDIRDFVPAPVWLALLGGISAAGVGIVGYAGAGYYPFLPLRHVLAALAMLLLFAGPVGMAIASRCLAVARPAAAVASISYGLYVLHYPLLVDWRRAHAPLGLAGAMLALIALSWLVDRWLNARLPNAPRT